MVENVIPYYTPLIAPNITLDRHHFWTNLSVNPKKFGRDFAGSIKDLPLDQLCKIHNIDPSLIAVGKWDRNHDRKRTILRNCVDWRIAAYLWRCMEGAL